VIPEPAPEPDTEPVHEGAEEKEPDGAPA